ncbi:MAG: 2-C-methyl-D-erythritol 4-phosphate cytidylyltransferase [Candidatus Marinimicrobia bacterium]|nr:2-C-methyl-D-erythritol 4-phosphate cytidylyltransferase [Candidatus Neomarinimicrobiota bacterium]MCF7829057.1 2-C-methyl-D-erythritol 4-phosphate cytidylyltransferase [Candidatus Neomarinimicrobiota bacterium]MCF7881806.1 2-C-methyl-D-erythritol 4-phosphate cytidylyltransferase [Candidatus Neomarinimicrobiota bacterium]
MTSTQQTPVIAVIPAAGSGTRLQPALGQPKQFALLSGTPVLTHTLQVFQRCESIDGIVISTHQDYIDRIQQDIIRPYGISKVVKVIPGGETRQDSVRNGLDAVEEVCPEIAVVHDAARPFVTPEIITASVETAREFGGCIVGIPVVDTIKQVSEHRIKCTVDRSKLWAAQTPQTFQYNLLLRAFDEANQSGFQGTDEAMLVERLGESVRIIEGSGRNMKITTPEDFAMAEALMTQSKTSEPA